MTDTPPDRPQPEFLTTREVADLLRVKERKVYDLAAAGEIPHRRITGKLLFPAAELRNWLETGDASVPPAPASPRPALVAGSHDPLLDWAIRESGSGLATLFDGSLTGIDVFADRRVALTGLHLPDAEGGWNIGAVAQRGITDAVLIGWAVRSRGILLSPALTGSVTTLDTLIGRRVVMRQPGAGAGAVLDRLLSEAGLAPDALTPADGLARTETDAAAAVATGEADAAIGLETMAGQYRLGFVPLLEEQFDLLIDRRSYFTEPVQRLLAFARTAAFAHKAAAMGGYTLAEAGIVRWLSP